MTKDEEITMNIDYAKKEQKDLFKILNLYSNRRYFELFKIIATTKTQDKELVLKLITDKLTSEEILVEVLKIHGYNDFEIVFPISWNKSIKYLKICRNMITNEVVLDDGIVNLMYIINNDKINKEFVNNSIKDLDFIMSKVKEKVK
jgi:hypothetical protein